MLNKNKCFYDPTKYTELCINNSNIMLNYARKGKNEYNKWIKNIDKSKDLSVDDKMYYHNNLNNITKKPIFSTDQTNIVAFTCEHDDDYNRDVLLLAQSNSISKLQPINLKSGSCKKILSDKLFKSQFLPIELFDDYIKKNNI